MSEVGACTHNGAGGVGTAFEFFGDCDIQGVDDGLRHVELGEILHLTCIVNGFGIVGKLGVEADGALWSWVVCVGPWGSGFHAYSAGCSARPRYPHSSDWADWMAWSLSKRSCSSARMLLWLGRGCRDGREPIVSVAMAREVSYAGGAMIGAGGAMIGTAGSRAAAAAAAASLAAMV